MKRFGCQDPNIDIPMKKLNSLKVINNWSTILRKPSNKGCYRCVGIVSIAKRVIICGSEDINTMREVLEHNVSDKPSRSTTTTIHPIINQSYVPVHLVVQLILERQRWLLSDNLFPDQRGMQSQAIGSF